MEKHNFSAGPCILPQEVFKEASKAVVNFNNSGLSLIEISHRSKDFVAVLNEAKNLVKELLAVPKTHEVLFLQGGASNQFLMSTYNLMKIDGKAAYLDTGTWSSKAIKEAKLFGTVDIISSSKDKEYTYIPKNTKIPSDVDYVHFTSNNTIYGTQYKEFPTSEAPLVCDMSSDIFSRIIDVSKFGIIYAGAQKNIGPAGTVLVIVKKDILGKTGREIPSMLNYQLMIEKESMFNTPPVFSIYTCMLNLRWLKKQGGITSIEKINKAKANLLYNEIDNNPLFISSVNKEDRSTMNVTFHLKEEQHQSIFDKICDNAGINGVKGHRSVGGYRASIYNALAIESVQVLVNCMKQLHTELAEQVV